MLIFLCIRYIAHSQHCQTFLKIVFDHYLPQCFRWISLWQHPEGFSTGRRSWKYFMNIASQIRNLGVTDISADNKHIHTHKSVFLLQKENDSLMPGAWTKIFHLFWCALFQVLNIEPKIRERWHCYNPSTTTPIFSLNIETFWWIWDSKDSLVIGSWLWLMITRQGGRSWQPFGVRRFCV